jgi:dihydrofolate reductase
MECIVAVDVKNGIAKNGWIPWKCKEDMAFFKEKTKHNVVVMGKTTFFTLPNGPLTDRLNIVFTRTPDIYGDICAKYPNVLFTNNPNIVYTDFHYPFLQENYKIFIIGGLQIYNMFLPQVNIVWMTRILQDWDCDTHFHLKQEKDWYKETVRQHRDFDIFKYSRISN